MSNEATDTNDEGVDSHDDLEVPGLPDGDDDGHPFTEEGEPMPI